MNQREQSAELSPLGKKTAYPVQYDPNLLFAIPRNKQRVELGLSDSALPFRGVDLWTSFELSWLNHKGKPQVGIARFVLPAESPNLIESKSFKLYLNSYNQTRLPSLTALISQLSTDLTNAAGAPVNVTLTLPERFAHEHIAELPGESLDTLDITIPDDGFSLDASQLRADPSISITETLCSHLLKSNCLITGQPDWASIMIAYTGPRIERETLLRYLISYRQHQEFHEQCIERIFCDILRHCRPKQLTVYARYTRRGGLDINPYRTNTTTPAPADLRTARQ